MPPYGYKTSYIAFDEEIRAGLDFILSHFNSSFPRKISTKTTQCRQIWVNNKEEALARFKQANYLDCRISAYSDGDIKDDPNFIFIDIDSGNQKLINGIISRKFSKINGHPTVLFTGSGHHIYQPIESVCLDNDKYLVSYDQPSRQFLKFAEIYLSDHKSDRNHKPSFNSCMVRIPGSINSKNNLQVKIVQEWNRHRPNIILLLGSFYAWIMTEQKKQSAKFAKAANYKNFPLSKIGWIEKVLKTPLDDYRKTIVNLVLAPYLTNIRQLQYQEALEIIKLWLESCAAQRKLDFNTHYLINNALVNACKTGYKPMRLDTLKNRNYPTYQKLRLS